MALQRNPNLFSKKLLRGFKVSAKGGQILKIRAGKKEGVLGKEIFARLAHHFTARPGFFVFAVANAPPEKLSTP